MYVHFNFKLYTKVAAKNKMYLVARGILHEKLSVVVYWFSCTIILHLRYVLRRVYVVHMYMYLIIRIYRFSGHVRRSMKSQRHITIHVIQLLSFLLQDKYILISMGILCGVCIWHAVVPLLHESNAQLADNWALGLLGGGYAFFHLVFFLYIYFVVRIYRQKLHFRHQHIAVFNVIFRH